MPKQMNLGPEDVTAMFDILSKQREGYANENAMLQIQVAQLQRWVAELEAKVGESEDAEE